jgi:hypothetical protein
MPQSPHPLYQAAQLRIGRTGGCRAAGLEDSERTTYYSVRMDWALDTPEDFRRGLVHGIAQSDGSVSIASLTVEFWIGPNWHFFKCILRTFGVESLQNREDLSVTKNQIQKLAKAAHIERGKRIPPEIRDFMVNSSKALSVPQLSEKVLEEFGVALSFESVQRWGERRRIYAIGVPSGRNRGVLPKRSPE